MKLRNRKPVFVLGFARGGTGLVWNLLQSHPDLCRTGVETHQVFRGRWSHGIPGEDGDPLWINARRLLNYLPIFILQRQDTFAQRWTGSRRPFTRAAAAFIDRALHRNKMHACSAKENLYKAPGLLYTRAEVAHARLLCKNVNGLIALSPHFARLYADATFVGVVRNGLAVCEGHMRRGRSAAAAARIYRDGCRAMLADADRIPRYHIFRFEDLLADTEKTVHAMYAHCDLDMELAPRFRYVPRKVVDASGQHRTAGQDAFDELVWCDLAELAERLRQDVNHSQIDRLSEEDRKTITDIAGAELKTLGYA